MRWWKLVGLAGVAGVAASGVLIARDERQRNAYTADEVRSRLHDRAQRAEGDESQQPAPGDAEASSQPATGGGA